MSLSTADIQWLRGETGVGMMDAKKALEATNGDREAAVEALRKSGAKVAAAKSTRTVKDGAVGIAISADRRQAAMVALACETDFVARTPDFQALVNELAVTLLHLSVGQPDITLEQFLVAPAATGTVTDLVNAALAKMGENMQVTGIATITGEQIGDYIHSNHKLGAVVAMTKSNDDLAHDLAMHVAAMNPLYRVPADVPADVLAKEEEVYRAQLKADGKPEAMWGKILPGKVAKFYSEVCLVKQPFVKDDKQRVEQVIGPAEITGFRRLAV